MINMINFCLVIYDFRSHFYSYLRSMIWLSTPQITNHSSILHSLFQWTIFILDYALSSPVSIYSVYSIFHCQFTKCQLKDRGFTRLHLTDYVRLPNVPLPPPCVPEQHVKASASGLGKLCGSVVNYTAHNIDFLRFINLYNINCLIGEMSKELILW